ncbi:MAG: HAMP domain-containing histidine kinase [Myxococcales bacterium]|nr:MAG: HAMP domain-containing histidine kinase [Myxococcales bacterium]
MRGGLRLQILLLLGGLLLLAFVPLFYAVATYTSVTLQQLRVGHARALGRAIAAHVAEARERRSEAELMGLLRAEVGTEGVEAIGVYSPAGQQLAAAGEPEAVAALPRRAANREGLREQGTGAAVLTVTVPSPAGAVVAVLRVDDQSARAAPLVRLVGLYMALVALSLLVIAYFALTRLIVRPLDGLSRAAERVASGARRLLVPKTSVRELAQLGQSVAIMTDRLLLEEDKLRTKIDEVERATVRLKEAQDRLVRSERLASVGRLAAGLAHEIGNPISALIGLQDLVLAGGLTPEEERDFLIRMRKETERINRILRDLLQFARPAAERISDEATAEPGDVEAAARDTAALVAPQRSLKEVALELDVPSGLPAVSLGHEPLMQVILNLVMNAADAVGPGGNVRISAAPAGSGVRLAVEDDGPGVDARVQAQLFEPFVTTKEVGKGTGLGLAVCRGLVEAAGGTITLDRGYTRGARFVVELPASNYLSASRQ